MSGSSQTRPALKVSGGPADDVLIAWEDAGRASGGGPPSSPPFPTDDRSAVMPRTSSRTRTATVVPLGSLTQPGSRSGAGCRACGSLRITQIAMRMTDGSPVEFTSCHECEHRSWEQQGQRLGFDSVLDKARKPA